VVCFSSVYPFFFFFLPFFLCAGIPFLWNVLI
jgi:hypothetical protein